MSADGAARKRARRLGPPRLLATLAALALTAQPAAAATLLDAIRLAYQTNPTLRGKRADLRATGEGYTQARAGLGPTLSVNAQGGYSIARVQSQASAFSGATDTTHTGDTANASISLVQPLLSFGANSAKVRNARDSLLAGEETLRQTEAQIIGQVITAYLNVRRDREVLAILRDEIGRLVTEFNQIKAQGGYGVLTRTDVAEAQARMLQAQSQLDISQGQLLSDAADYLSVVGENPDQLDPEPELAGVPVTVDAAFTAAEHNNPQILSAIQSELAAREQVNEAKAAYGPTVSLRVDAGAQPVVPYLPNVYDRNVTVSAVVNQPLFTSGMRDSKVREAMYRDSEAVLQIEATRRDVVKAVAQAWSQFVSARAAEKLSEAEVEADKVAVEGAEIEEQVGRRSTFELLNEEVALANARINLLQNKHDKYVAQVALLQGMGLLEARYITPGLETYDTLKSIRQRGDATPWQGAIESIDDLLSRHATTPPVSPSNAGSTRPIMISPADSPVPPAP
jgi:outer membrane protein